MKIQKNKIYTLLATFISIFFGVYLWKIINIPYHSNGIIGLYSLNNYSSLNDPIKYLTFIMFQSLHFCYARFILKKKILFTYYFFLGKMIN